MDGRRALLRRVAIFAELGDDELAAIPTASRALRRREVLFRAGDPGGNAFVVASGRLKVTTVAEDGRELLIQIVEPGKVIGEMAMLDGEPRSATVVALEAAKLVVIERRELLALVRRHPAVALRLLALLGGRVRQLSAALEDAVYLDLPTRLARRVLSLAERFGRRCNGGMLIEVRLAQRELGDMVGFSRESINKQVRAWTDAGVLSMEGGFITVHDTARLATLARLSVV